MRLRSLGSALLACVLCGRAGATVIYSYVTDQTSYTGTVGQTVPVRIYLQETGTPSLVSTYNGLFVAGAAVAATTGGGATIASNSFSYNQTTGNFDGGSSLNKANYNYAYSGAGSGNNVEFVEGQNASDTTGVAADLNGRVYLGTLNVTVGAASTSFQLTSLTNEPMTNGIFRPNTTQSPLDFNTFTNFNYDTGLDSDSNSLATGANSAAPALFSVGPATASPVPEPASFGLIAAAAGFGFVRRRRESK